MIEKIQKKIEEIIGKILEKPVEKITKEEFEMLTHECGRLKADRDSKENSKRWAETISRMWN